VANFGSEFPAKICTEKAASIGFQVTTYILGYGFVTFGLRMYRSDLAGVCNHSTKGGRDFARSVAELPHHVFLFGV
jgi:hypothetical protein